MVPGAKIGCGKTKIVFQDTNNPDLVLIKSTDSITAGNGKKRETISGKGRIATETTTACFNLLNRNNIPTHFIKPFVTDPSTFLAHRCLMIPIEIVLHRAAYGSIIKRNPHLKEDDRFNEPIIEFFLKDDSRNDPLMILQENGQIFDLYDAYQPTGEKSFIGTIDIASKFLASPKNDIETISHIAQRAFACLEQAWQKQNVTLVDLKLEFGISPFGSIVIADVIDNDSWRIWPNGDKTQMLDKEVFRRIPNPTSKDMYHIKKLYKQVAAMTKKFNEDEIKE